MEISLDWIYHFRPFSANLAQLVDKLPFRSQTGIFQNEFIHFRQFPATLGSAGSQAPSPQGAKRAKILDWIYLFQSISSNFGFSLQLSPPVGKQGFFLFYIYPLYISENFQQLWVQLAVKPPLSQEPNSENFQTGFNHFRQFLATLVSAGRNAPSQEPNRQFFRLNLSISSNFQQLWVQLAVKLPPRG